MGFIRRMLAIALGLGAGVLAIKILQDYNKDRYIEGEFVELSGQEGEADHPHAAAQPQPASLVQLPPRPRTISLAPASTAWAMSLPTP